MDRGRVLAMIGECAVCGRPASDLCDCCHTTLTGGWADIIADISRDALELRALRAVARWCKENTADLGILLYEDQFCVVELRLSGTQTLMWKGRPLVDDSITALADTLGLDWRKP